MPIRNGDFPPPVLVHWHEGLFLEPHHLQLLQQQQLGLAAVERQRLMHYPYGCLSASLSETDLVHRFRIRFEHLRVVLRSGLEVCYPGNAELPEKDITDAFNASGEPFVVSLGVPVRVADGANVLDDGAREDWRANRLFRAASIEVRDENTGQNPRPVQIRKVNARLLVPGDDTNGLDVLPLLRVVSHATEGRNSPRRDPRFVPATLLLAGSDLLTEMVHRVINHLRQRRAELVDSVARLGKVDDVQPVRGDVFKKYARLRIYNRYFARLQHLFACDSVTPSEMYFELRSFLAELASFEPERAAMWEVERYNHDSPFICFDELCKKLQILMPGQGPTSERVEFQRQPHARALTLTDAQLRRPIAFFLAVRTKAQRERLRALVESDKHFKLAAQSDFSELHKPGLALAWESPPIVAPEDEHFFKIDRRNSGLRWDKVLEERVLWAKWQEMERSDLQLSLVMMLPGQEAQ